MGAKANIFRRDAFKKAETTKGLEPPAVSDQYSGARRISRTEGGRSGNDGSDAAAVKHEPPPGEEEKMQGGGQQEKEILLDEAEAKKILSPAAWHVYKRAMNLVARGGLERVILERAVTDYAADVARLAGCPPGSGDTGRLLQVGTGGDVEAFRRCLLLLLVDTRFP